MNSNFYPMNNLASRSNQEDEEERRRRSAESKNIGVAQPSPPTVRLAQHDPWGQGGTCLGLKILCGGLGLVVVILIVVLVIKMVHKKGEVGSSSPSQDSNLPMSIQGGFHFADESLMSTSI